MAQDTQLPDDEERRLISDAEACRAKELDAADQLSHQRQSTLYPAYKRLVDALGVIRLMCSEKTRAVWAYRKKMRDERE